MKQLVVALIAALSVGTVAAQDQPTVLAHAEAQGVTVNGSAIPAASSLGAKPGDVIAVAAGEARVTFANGCTVTIPAGAPYTVPASAPPCASPSRNASTDLQYYWATGAGLAVAAGLVRGAGDDKPSSP